MNIQKLTKKLRDGDFGRELLKSMRFYGLTHGVQECQWLSRRKECQIMEKTIRYMLQEIKAAWEESKKD